MEERETARRPDPNALLALDGNSARGKLTVFLGAAPGVGKTFSMLDRVRHLKATDVDILVGLVETHGREETAALLEGLEVLPRLKIEYRGRQLEEFDLDAALARKPQIVLVDEMAHTNAEGSRHPKRYQDIEELIHAGIDVWTALNIQHLESLSDIVAQITGIKVREIVPDIAFKKADEVILVDILPAELIGRLKQGKVYLPQNAERAIEGFFKPANLTALRELALRRTADRVDDQMVDFLRQSAIEGPWATSERLLVLVGPDPLSEKVVRTASRLASGLNAPWLVVSMMRPGATPGAGAIQRLDDTLRLAERLGAETRRVTADNFVSEIMKIARRENVTQIMVGRLPRSLFAKLTRRSLPDRLIAQAGDISVHVVSADMPQEGAAPEFKFRSFSARNRLEAFLLPAVAVVAITLVGRAITAILTLQNIAMLYLVAVVICGVVSGRLSAIVAAILSFLAYNFFFIAPVHTLAIDKPHEFFALVVFLAAAIFTAELAGRIREQAERARRQERATQALYDFSRKLSGAARVDTVIDATAAHLYAETGKGIALLVQQEGELVVGSIWPPDLVIDQTAMTAARWAFEKGEPAGHATSTLPQIPWQFRPILAARKPAGILGLLLGETGALLPSEEQIVHGVLEQAAVAIDRARLFRESTRTAALEESERLHSALFASLARDLKAPLATISASVAGLKEQGEHLDAPTRAGLLDSIDDGAARLERLAADLFNVTRLDAGTLKLKQEKVDIGDAVDSALDRIKKLYPGHSFEVSLAAGLPLIEADANLVGQVLFNLLENACQYGGDGLPISVFARQEGNEVMISVTDQGKGIPERDLERIFEKFYRRSKGEGRSAGMGLGLPIARGFVQAMGGTIKAESPAARRRGTRFVVRLPVGKEPGK